MSGYKDINLRALRLLNPGGHLITCTCSAHVDEGMFGGIILSAATDAQVRSSWSRNACRPGITPSSSARRRRTT